MRERRKPQEDALESIITELDGELRKLRMSKLRIGRLLLKARPLVQHGQWVAYVEARGLTDRTARNYMALAESEKFSDLPDDADPTYRAAGMLADLSPAEPEQQADSEPPNDTDEKPERCQPSLSGRIHGWLLATDGLGIPDCPEMLASLRITDTMKTAQEARDLAEWLRSLAEALENIELGHSPEKAYAVA